MTTRGLTLQTSLLGLAAGAFAVPLGVLPGDLMIPVVNLRSFGWTMELKVPIGALPTGLVLDWSGALLADLYPGDPRRPGRLRRGAAGGASRDHTRKG